jgi:outer membrane protein OmpA-like peptidoglycan-associated protein
MKKICMRPGFTAFPLLFIFFPVYLAAQENLQVSRARAVDFRSRVINIAVDANNTKWISTDKGLFEVKANDMGTQVPIPDSEQDLYSFPGGNAALRWNKESLQKQLGGVLSATNVITAATYDVRKDVLWIGTSESGAYSLKTKPALQLVSRLNTSTTKMASNTVNCLFLDARGQIWIGTDGGALYGVDGRWSVEQKFFSIQSIVQQGGDIWVLADDLLWKVGADNKWIPADIPQGAVEGQAMALAAGPDGRTWVASERIAVFTPEQEDLKTFGPADYYTSQFPNCIVVDLDGAVWIGTADKGVYVIEKASAWNLNIIVLKNPDCNNNQPIAEIEAKISGGNPPFSFVWQNGQTTASLKGIGPGTYEVTATDSKGKLKTAKVALTDQRVTAQAVMLSPQSKENALDGSAEISVSGGTPPYSVRWDNGESGLKAIRLSQGTHFVDATDTKGCKAQAKVEITQKTADLSLILTSKKEVSCNAAKDGALILEASGGVGPYAFSWNIPSLSGPSAANLPAGTYIVTLTDSQNKKSTGTFVLEAPPALSVTVLAEKPASTNGKDGIATVTIAGGTPPYAVQWQNGGKELRLTGLPAGSYSVQVTDANGCKGNAVVEITENILPLSIKIAQTAEIRCAGNAEAALEATVSGGKGPFTFSWNDPTAQGQAPKALKAGVYQLQVKDASGKSASATFTVKGPEPLTAQATASAPASTGNQDGKASVTTNGGKAPYSFRWDNGETSQDAVNLAPGQRAVTVTDANGCTATSSVSITENILPLKISLELKQAISCSDRTDGILAVILSGGKKPYQIKWSQGSSDLQATSLGAGNYQVTITDAVGNTGTAASSLESPPPVTISWISTSGAGSQPDGQATVQAKGGSGTFSYRWDNGETNPGALGLAAGRHQVTATDAKGCSAVAEKEIPKRLIEGLVAGRLQPGQVIPLEQVRFEVDSTNFNERSLPMLTELFEFMVKNPGLKIEIGGHTSNLCSDAICDQISSARAKSVADYLVRKGMDPIRVSSKGYGKRQPIANNDTQEGRTKNQRVEVKVLTVPDDAGQ